MIPKSVQRFSEKILLKQAGESDCVLGRLCCKIFRHCSLLAVNTAGEPFFPRRAAIWGGGHERTDAEAASRRERSETADGRRDQGHGKGAGSRRENGRQGRRAF